MPHGKTHSTDWVGGGHAIPPHRGGARARAHSVTSRAALQLLGQQIGACQADTLDAYRLWHRAGRDTETGDRVEIKIISAHASTRRGQANAKQLQSYSKSAGSAELPTWGAHKAVAGQLAVVDVHLERVDDVLLVLALELHDELCGVALCLRCERLAVAVPSLPLPRLLEDARRHARDGVAVTPSQETLTRAKLPELADVPGFADAFLLDGQVPREGQVLRQPALANTLERLGTAGLDDFYRGELATALAGDLARAGSPVTRDDLAAYQARVVEPLSTRLRTATLYNQPPPTQGMASLMILGMFDRLGVTEAEGFDHIHGLVEATKQAFLIRDRHCTDPAYMDVDPADFLTDADLAQRAARIDPATALPWPQPALPGDTIWMGCIDREGRGASFIQSIYWEFGSGVVLPATGVLWQNRGISFSLDDNAPQALKPGRKPFHTLNPAMARFDDGRTMVYGTMGGEGQPQTQAAVFSRYGLFNQPLQQAVTAMLRATSWEASASLVSPIPIMSASCAVAAAVRIKSSGAQRSRSFYRRSRMVVRM